MFHYGCVKYGKAQQKYVYILPNYGLKKKQHFQSLETTETLDYTVLTYKCVVDLLKAFGQIYWCLAALSCNGFLIKWSFGLSILKLSQHSYCIIKITGKKACIIHLASYSIWAKIAHIQFGCPRTSFFIWYKQGQTNPLYMHIIPHIYSGSLADMVDPAEYLTVLYSSCA